MTLVLIHGAGETPALWDRVIAHLEGIPLMIPELPGRGSAVWPESERSRDVAAYARIVLAAMDRDGIGSATIAGHSLGGAIALSMGLERPERVDGLGLICTGARLRVTPALLDALADGVRDIVDVIVNGQTTPKTSDRDRVVLKRMLETVGMEQTLQDLTACDRFDMMSAVASIRARTQIIAGDVDAVTPTKYSQFLHDAIPGSRLTTFAGIGHAVPIERAEAVAGELAVLWAASHRPAGSQVALRD